MASKSTAARAASSLVRPYTSPVMLMEEWPKEVGHGLDVHTGLQPGHGCGVSQGVHVVALECRAPALSAPLRMSVRPCAAGEFGCLPSLHRPHDQTVRSRFEPWKFRPARSA
jgi:hypothetical protein